jgi:ribonuclease R
MREGSIDFETPESEFRFDEDGYPVEIIKKVRLGSHRLVEEFMLLANKTVARHIGASKSNEDHNPFVYRVHDVPDPGKLKDLALFVANFGHKLNTDNLQAKDLQKLLETVKGTEEEYVINDVAIRSMAKAVYSEKNIGHFGLGFKHYTHFTSPIRRYPDLIVHRLFLEYANGMEPGRRSHYAKILPEVCIQCSETERKATGAERESVKIKQVEYMDRHIGDELHGIVSGVVNFGIFIEINDLLIEGMVRVRDMEDDYYMYDEKKYALIGRRTGKRYRIGDTVKVQVISVNIENREINFRLVD